MQHIPEELKEKNNILYKKLVPIKGKADTLEGEFLRAINRILYRFYNDGDVFYEGCGKETCGPAVDFLSDKFSLKDTFERIENSNEKDYEETLINILKDIINHIENKKELTESDIDMYDYYDAEKHNDYE